ncbi:hypothetical protein C5P09_17675 [Escherichia coli]|nr:hypothetical protein C5P09_17675 [Escherichia coli]
MMSLWDALRMNMMISYQELVRTFPNAADISANAPACTVAVAKSVSVIIAILFNFLSLFVVM